MEPLEFGKFIVTLINQFWDSFSICRKCQQGEAIVKVRNGKPIKWRTTPRWYWKLPILDVFEVVDMRRRFSYSNANSYHSNDFPNSLIPYNIVIDVQIEYQITHPYVIFYIEGEGINETKNNSYINNIVHKEISKYINESPLFDYCGIHSELSNICERNKHNTFKEGDEYEVEKGISLNDIILTSFDKNISIRSTI